MNISTRIGVGGAGPHIDKVRIIPVDSKILLFMFSLHLIEFML